MIPREILKKIRQIELRTNRIVSAMLVGFSFQPPPQFRRISRTVENRHDADKIFLNRKIDAVTVEDFHPGFVNGVACKWKSFRVLKDAGERGVNFSLEPVAQAWLLLLVPKDGVFKFQTRLWFEDYLAGHARRCARRSFNSARTLMGPLPRFA